MYVHTNRSSQRKMGLNEANQNLGAYISLWGRLWVGEGEENYGKAIRK